MQSAYLEVHDGWSSDEVLLQDALHEAFLAACRRQAPDAEEADLNWTLLNLRKAGRLSGTVTRRRHDRHDGYRHLAEIAARLLQDRHEVTTDRLLCDPGLRAEFDQTVRDLTSQIDPYLLRKAVLALRKQRQLRPELVARVVDWGREIRLTTVDEARAQPWSIPARPGVYLFRDDTGYLYIGEAADLRERLSQHVHKSDRTSLADYLASEVEQGSQDCD